MTWWLKKPTPRCDGSKAGCLSGFTKTCGKRTNYVELLLIRHAREQLSNEITDDGERADNLPWSRRSDLYVPGAGHLPTAQPRKRRR